MSFITKRERVFNNYDLFDLPPRNEGKLKAYASCTDARAWSHFCSDKTEHLVDIIKRNNDTCRPKYVPTDVIVQTLMVAKNAEIGKLRRKIEEFEQMLAAYDQLELNSEQRREIDNAHASIKAANKELDDLCLDLDLSGFTEGIDSDVYETGKSRGDEPSRYGYDEGMSRRTEMSGSAKSRGDDWGFEKGASKMESKSNQTNQTCSCDASTSAEDARIQEMQDTIISKDAKLSAMQNTIAVMENDVCEPYCIYAQIYTSLEKILAVLCQNDKYKLYLNLMTAGKDIRCVDIKGKIFFKLKVLEKFSVALIAPCSQEKSSYKNCACSQKVSSSPRNCACLRAEVVAPCEYLQTSQEYKKPAVDDKRAQLVADIMGNDELKEIINKNISLGESEEKFNDDDDDLVDSYSIETENFKRLKLLQEDYNDLMMCYEKLKHENKNLHLQCHQYEELEKEYKNLRYQLQEYNNLWNEKEYFKNRSIDLDSLKDQYIVLANETSDLESKIKAEVEINKTKSCIIDELRSENIELEKKINQASIDFEKEKNILQCKLKESECTIICQEQQIKSLSLQIDRLLEQGHDKEEHDGTNSVILINEIDTLKDQINNLKESLYVNAEEKHDLQENFENSLRTINELKLEIDVWKSSYEKATQRNNYLEKYTENFREEVNRLNDESVNLSQEVKEKTNVISNLKNEINKRSKEIEKLLNKIDQNDVERGDLQKELQNITDSYNHSVIVREKENAKALEYLHIARQESEEILNRVQQYNERSSKSYSDEHLKINNTKDEMMKYENPYFPTMSLAIRNNNTDLLDEIENIRDINSLVNRSLHVLHEENNAYRSRLEITKKESDNMENKLLKYKNLSEDMKTLQDAYHNLEKEKDNLKKELTMKKSDLNIAIESTQCSKNEYQKLVEKLQAVEIESNNLKDKYNILLQEKNELQSELVLKSKEMEFLSTALSNRDKEFLKSLKKIASLEGNLNVIKTVSDTILAEKNVLKHDLEGQLENLNSILESKTKENLILLEKIRQFENESESDKNQILSLENENQTTLIILNNIKTESDELINKLNEFENLQKEYEKIKTENEVMQENLTKLTKYVNEIEEEKNYISGENQQLQSINETLEKSLIESRNQQILSSSSPKFCYEDVMTYLEAIKKEKIKSQQKIENLLHKLNESEKVILNLNEGLFASHNKIAMLENHINNLEDEIRTLQSKLEKVIETGEQISVNSIQKHKLSIINLEAKHSKVQRNIEEELAKLQKEYAVLKEKLSATILCSKESSADKNKYLSQVIHFQNEMERLVASIKELEIHCVGSSSLSQFQCSTENILESLNQIGKSFDLKNYSLENTITKVQTSSQLLLSKADEAKKLIEREKQKIVMEKEEAIREKTNMENELEKLKNKLERERFIHAENVRDLGAKTMNQNLISQNKISNLKTELKNLQSQYQNSLEEIKDLKEKFEKITILKSQILINHDQLIEDLQKKAEDFNAIQNELCEMKNKSVNHDQLITDLQKMSQDFNTVQNELYKIKNRSFIDFGVQASLAQRNEFCQTHELLNTYQGVKITKSDKSKCVRKTDVTLPHLDLMNCDDVSQQKQASNLLPKQHFLNEVQIFTANIEPNFDFVKHSYLNYKFQRLSCCPLKLFSVSNQEPSDCNFDNTIFVNDNHSCLINIYNHSMGSDSSNYIYLGNTNNHDNKNISKDMYIDNGSIDKNILNSIQESRKCSKTVSIKSSTTIVRQTDKHVEDENSAKTELHIYIPEIGTESHVISTASDLKNKSVDSKYNSTTNPRKNVTNSLSNTLDYETDGKNHRQYDFDSSYNDLPSQSVSDAIPDVDLYSNVKYTMFQETNAIKEPANDNNDWTKELDLYLYPNTFESRPDLKTQEGIDEFPLNCEIDKKKNTENIKLYSKETRKSKSVENMLIDSKNEKYSEPVFLTEPYNISTLEYRTISSSSEIGSVMYDSIQPKYTVEKAVMVNLDVVNDIKENSEYFTKAIDIAKKDYRTKLEAIKCQYDNNIKTVINDHNEGVKNIQGLHEQTLRDIIQMHENEVENLRSMTIEANQKAEKLEKENLVLKKKYQGFLSSVTIDEEPIKLVSESKKTKKLRRVSKLLSKTNVVECNVKPKLRLKGPCTCTLDINVSDTIQNMFEQVDVDQRKTAEDTYIKYIARKIISNSVETLDTSELSFLHLKVCRTWKNLEKEDTLQKRIFSLESELINRQRNAQQHIAELDRKVEAEKRRLQEVREAVFRSSPISSRAASPQPLERFAELETPPVAAEIEIMYPCTRNVCDKHLSERRSAGDLVTGVTKTCIRPKRARPESNRAVSAKLDMEERKARKLYTDEPPTRLHATKHGHRGHKK